MMGGVGGRQVPQSVSCAVAEEIYEVLPPLLAIVTLP